MLNSLKHAWKKQRALKLYRRFLKPGQVCFDIGANMGDKTDLFLGCGAKVIAVEPQPACIARLQQRFASQPSAFTCIQKAVHADVTTLQLHVCNMNEVSSLSASFIDFYRKYDYLSWDHVIPVETTTLDLLIGEFGVPAYCKIDVEGWELNVLKGLSKPIPLIEFEFNRPFMMDAMSCTTHLARSLGPYVFNYSTYENFKLELKSWLPLDEFTTTMESLPEEMLTGDIYCRIL